MWKLAALLSAVAVTPVFAAADYTKINSKSKFVQLVQGKTLTRPLIKLKVSPNGKISGRGASWDVEGSWSWKNGYFCRDLFWGGDALGYNCQEVGLSDGKLRFTSDQGRGDSAEFRLR
ncbi:MAG: dihydrodipicolinate reductase [Pseudomonadota bacterium]